MFVNLLFELFYDTKVLIEIKIHHKEPIELLMIKRLKTPYLVKKPQKVNKQKFHCKNLRFILVVLMSWTRYQTCFYHFYETRIYQFFASNFIEFFSRQQFSIFPEALQNYKENHNEFERKFRFIHFINMSYRAMAK